MKNTKLDAESYLKSGSNELRILEYRTSGLSFGINILKVNKIVSEMKDFTEVPESHPNIKGIFRDMDRLVPVADLAAFLNIEDKKSARQKVIVTEFFGMKTGFLVDHIDWIHHFKWADVIDAEKVFNNLEHPYVIGIVKPVEERMIQLLDYETILLKLNPNLIKQHTKPTLSIETIADKKVLIAEDSPAVRSMLTNELTELGFEVTAASDGKHGWEFFQKNDYDLVICDVEMPQMDGLALTLNIRQSVRGNTPIIVYSSIGDIGMKARAKFLKADAHITKLNLDKLIETAQKLVSGERVDLELNAEQSKEKQVDKTLIPS